MYSLAGGAKNPTMQAASSLEDSHGRCGQQQEGVAVLFCLNRGERDIPQKYSFAFQNDKRYVDADIHDSPSSHSSICGGQ